MSHFQLTPGGIATLACMLELSAPKPGNVHRGADFEDVTFVDFATSAVVLGDVIGMCTGKRPGETILSAVRRTQSAVGTNTNLGIVLLLVPLAKILEHAPGANLDVSSISDFLARLTTNDGADVFEAIRIAKPGGLGEADELDVNQTGNQPVDLISAMQFAADRDSIAKQFVTGYKDVIETGVPLLAKGRQIFGSLNQSIVFAHVAMMARQHDSLIARKCGLDVAGHAKFLAAKAIELLGPPDGPVAARELDLYWNAVGELDFWLRSDGHRRNPGTTADLIAASLYVGISNGTITPPLT